MVYSFSQKSKLVVPFNKTTCFLWYLAKTLKIEFAPLIFLYEKYGEDVLYFFYIMSGKKVYLPKEDRLVRYANVAHELYYKVQQEVEGNCLEHNVILKEKDILLYDSLKEHISDNQIVIEYEI